ncbi:MAG: hypothetical protein LAN62_03755 [Acidobacteriia bacterium]|nr:hypothetical protein [Terriglobia bacterium]
MRIAIVGYGVVGRALAKLFDGDKGSAEVAVYDRFIPSMNTADRKAAIQACDLAFIAVPTPEGCDGACDVSAVEEVVSWVEPPMCLKSTVPPGTVDRLVKATGKRICFSPEVHGELFSRHEGCLCEPILRFGPGLRRELPRTPRDLAGGRKDRSLAYDRH